MHFLLAQGFGKSEKYHMDMNLFKKIIEEVTQYGMPAVNLNGLGEPILHPNLIEMIEHCKQSGIKDIMFHTNGTLMSEKRAKAMVKSGLTQIIFSLDSPDKETYEKMRVNAKFEKVMSNVERFVSIRNKLKSKLPLVRVTMVLTDKTKIRSKNLMKCGKIK